MAREFRVFLDQATNNGTTRIEYPTHHAAVMAVYIHNVANGHVTREG